MSYILSALKKADADRKSGNIPTALSPEPKALVGTDSRLANNKIFMIVCGLVLIGFIIWILYWSDIVKIPFEYPDSRPMYGQESTPLFPSDRQTMPAPSVKEPVSAPMNSLKPESIPAAPLTQPLIKTPLPAIKMPPSDLSVIEEKEPDYDQLPDLPQESLPTLRLTGHLYSGTQVRARKVIINGMILRENQSVGDDLTVEKILPDGVVVNFRGQRFKLHADQMFR